MKHMLEELYIGFRGAICDFQFIFPSPELVFIFYIFLTAPLFGGESGVDSETIPSLLR